MYRLSCIPAHVFARLMLALVLGWAASASAQTLRSEADNWIAECGASPDTDCSIIGVFKISNPGGPQGSFSLLVDLRNRQVAVVGKPPPSRVTIRIDRNPGFECRGERYCIFLSDAETIVRQLKSGSLVLVDVVAGSTAFRGSISTKGYRAALDKIRAQGFQDFSD